MSKIYNLVGGTGSEAVVPVSIEIITQPTKTTYYVGEQFDPSGMVIMTTYSNGNVLRTTNFVYSTHLLTVADDEITISSTEADISVETVSPIDVNKAVVAIPKSSESFVYTGDTHTPVWDGYIESIMTMGGDSSGTNAGEYTTVFSLRDTENYVWDDGTSSDKSITWSIAKAKSSISVSSEEVYLNVDVPTYSVSVTGMFDGTISAVSSDDAIVAVSVDGNTLTINSVDETPGEAVITVTCNEGTNYDGTGSVQITVKATFVEVSVYGVTWDGSSSSVMTRTDGAETFDNPVPYVSGATSYGSPFDKIMPWKGMVRVTDSEAGELVAIPKFWYKITQNGSTFSLQIANKEQDGFFVSPAHVDRGDGKGERDVVYVGRYKSCSTYKSTSGVKPLNSKGLTGMRTGIADLGETVWMMDYAMMSTIWLLYIVEFADWNSQNVIGYGCSSSTSAIPNCGLSDSMPYHTGTPATARTKYTGGIQYRYIEGLWEGLYEYLSGIYSDSRKVYGILNPADFAEDQSTYTSVGTLLGEVTNTTGIITGWSTPTASGFEGWLMPSSTDSSTGDDTYICDKFSYNGSSLQYFSHGAMYLSNIKTFGLFYLSRANGRSGTSSGCRLQKLP